MGMTVKFDVAKLKYDIAARGWRPTDLARAASVSNTTVWRALNGTHNPRTWETFARTLGYPVTRYLKGRVA